MPAYIKYVLKACGYENGISISTIENEDIQYFVEEVKNRNVSNYFKSILRETDILEGSKKTVENFVFSHGHIKLLMYIVRFIKNFIEENGPNSLSIEVVSKPNSGVKRPAIGVAFAPRKRIKSSPSNEDPGTLLSEIIKKQEEVLLIETFMSLITHLPETYVKVRLSTFVYYYFYIVKRFYLVVHRSISVIIV